MFPKGNENFVSRIWNPKALHMERPSAGEGCSQWEFLENLTDTRIQNLSLDVSLNVLENFEYEMVEAGFSQGNFPWQNSGGRVMI